MTAVSYMRLDHINPNLQLIKLLPPEVARRCHALPVATDGNMITVAMASPDDMVASTEVASAIGAPVCLVQADPKEIDKCLDNIWPQSSTPKLRLFVWSPSSDAETSLLSYSQGLAELLDANLYHIEIPWKGEQTLVNLVLAAEQNYPDLIIFQVPSPLSFTGLLIDSSTQKLIDRLPASLIVMHKPRWPLTKILLVLPDSGSSSLSAIEWTVLSAQYSRAAVTILPLLPPIPIMYGSRIKHSLSALLTSDIPLSRGLRSVSCRLAELGIEGHIKLRDGLPLDQLRNEVFATDPDLIIIASDSPHFLSRWVTGELVRPLLGLANRPLLIAKPKSVVEN